MRHFLGTKIKTGIMISVLLVLFAFSASAHTYVATYRNSSDCVCIGTADGIGEIYISVNGGRAIAFDYQTSDTSGNNMYTCGGDFVYISKDARTLICGNIYTRQTFELYLVNVNKVN